MTLAGRFRAAMPKIVPNVAKIDWGFYSENETRMHLQALGDAPKFKVWLEQNNKRCFIDAGDVPMKRGMFNELKTAVVPDRYRIDNFWFAMQIDLGHVKLEKFERDFKVKLTLYPGTNHANVKTLLLNKLKTFPDAADMMKHVALDASMAAISFGTHRPAERRYDLYLPDIFWGPDE
jgi:hypothetical protein